MAPSDPFHVAKDEDEQGPEEHSDDSGPDEDYDLHVGLVAWALTHKKKAPLNTDVLNYSIKALLSSFIPSW